MTGRTYWRRAHQVRLPDKKQTDPHIEMFAAYRWDQQLREIAEDLDRELRSLSAEDGR
jgi:hypothetical protein